MPEQSQISHKVTAGASYGYAITLLSLCDIFPNREIFPALPSRAIYESPAKSAEALQNASSVFPATLCRKHHFSQNLLSPA